MKQKSQQPINDAEYRDQYAKNKNQYDKLGVNLVQALELFLKERDIKVLSIDYRVKDDSSFAEKIDRKHYANPFDEIEDICGIRIICYYQSDVEKISEVLREEFTVIENQDKETLLKADQFGYRSTHFIVKIKKEWNKAPNYRGLENLKAEIQIRTVLMHAWAEIEHKLVYKNENQVPSHLRRKLSIISATLEDVDERFEAIKAEVTKYQLETKEKIEKNEYEGVELNLNSLQAFLDKHFPDGVTNMGALNYILDDFLSFEVTLKELFESYQKNAEYIRQITAEEGYLNRIGMLPMIIALTNDKYLSESHYVNQLYAMKWQKIIAADETAKNK
jgi:putative GTP pyrophosphokinase